MLPLQVIRATRDDMAESGVELTPYEVSQLLASSIAKVRRALEASGRELPESDTELLLVLGELL